MDAPDINISGPSSLEGKRQLRDGVPLSSEAKIVSPEGQRIATPTVNHAELIENLGKAVEKLNEALTKDPVSLRFAVDDTLNRPVVTVISDTTGEIIHQLPQEEVLRAVKNIDRMRGVLFEAIG